MRGLIVIGALALAQPAWAQEEAPAAAAARIIANANAQDQFETVDNGAISVRHRGSGLICRFEPGGGEIVFFPGLPRGEDVGCGQSFPQSEAITFYATRYPEATNNEEQMQSAVAAIAQRYAGAQVTAPDEPIEPPSSPEGGPAFPASLSEGFIVDAGRGRFYTHVSVAMVGRWCIKLRYTTPLRDHPMAIAVAQLRAMALWEEALEALAGRDSL